METIFTKIITGEIPSFTIAEDENFYAFLDINPVAKGHTLVIPKQPVDYIFDLDNEMYQDLFLFAKRIALAIGNVIPCKKVGIAVVGLEVPHAHIHLIPLNTIYDIDFKKEKLKLPPKEFTEIMDKIKTELRKLDQ